MKIMLWLIFAFVVLFVFLPFSPYLFLCLYEKCYSSTPICLSDFLNYFSNVFTGIIAILLSFIALRMSIRDKKISIETSKNVIRAFVELSRLGFKENSNGNHFRYYIINRNDFENHLQILINSNVLNKKKADLCRDIFNYIRNIKKGKIPKSDLKNVYTKFDGEDKFTKNIEEVLKRL